MLYNKKVIQFRKSPPPPPPRWTFWDFEFLNGNDPIEEWRQTLSDDAQFMFHDLLKTNQKTENPIHWIGFKRFLKGHEYAKHRIWELEFRADGKQYRVLGIFGEQRRAAILLVGCFHKMKVYTPADALDTAKKRAQALKDGKARTRERTIKTDF